MSGIAKVIGNLLHLRKPDTADSENEVWVFDNTAFVRGEAEGGGKEGEWRAEYVLAAFAKNEGWRKGVGEAIAHLIL
jgi:hypothetical protein